MESGTEGKGAWSWCPKACAWKSAWVDTGRVDPGREEGEEGEEVEGEEVEEVEAERSRRSPRRGVLGAVLGGEK
jgi:hypothetical protein